MDILGGPLVNVQQVHIILGDTYSNIQLRQIT